MTNKVGATIVISADVTGWSASQREELLHVIDLIESRGAVPDLSEIEPTGWTLDLYAEAMSHLLSKRFVQSQVINEAIKAGTGYIDRAAVYALGGYPETRSLKGFTRPINRVMGLLVESGKLPGDAPDLLSTVYDDKVRGYQRAKGFQVPLEIVKLIVEHNEGKPDP